MLIRSCDAEWNDSQRKQASEMEFTLPRISWETFSKLCEQPKREGTEFHKKKRTRSILQTM